MPDSEPTVRCGGRTSFGLNRWRTVRELPTTESFTHALAATERIGDNLQHGRLGLSGRVVDVGSNAVT